MEDSLRKSIWSKMSALSMIYLIVCGNIWFTLMVVGRDTPIWLLEASRFGAAVLLFSAAGFLTLMVGSRLGFFSREPEESSSPENIGS